MEAGAAPLRSTEEQREEETFTRPDLLFLTLSAEWLPESMELFMHLSLSLSPPAHRQLTDLSQAWVFPYPAAC